MRFAAALLLLRAAPAAATHAYYVYDTSGGAQTAFEATP